MSWSKCVRKWIALGMICVILCCAAVSCAELKQIRIRGTDTVIASGAIPSGQGIVIICPRGSKAETYAQNNNNKIVRTK